MKYKFILISCCLFFFAFNVLAQKTDVIILLKAGAELKGKMESNLDYKNLERVPFLDASNSEKSIPLKAIKEIKTTGGEVIFPVPEKEIVQTNTGNAQIILKAGAIIEGKLYNENADFASFERLKFIDAEGDEKDIPLVAISQIKNNKGEVIYPKTIQNQLEQKASQYDKLILNAGATLDVNLKLSGQNPATLEKIPFTDSEGNQRSIPLAAIAKLINKYGVTIYPNTTQTKPKPPVVVQEEKCNSDDLKQQMTAYMIQRYSDIEKSIEEQSAEFSPASYALESEIIEKVHKQIEKDVEALKNLQTALDASIKIYVNQKGKVVKIEEDIKSSKQLRNFTKLKEEKIYPYLRSLTYPTQEKAFEFENEYDNFYEKYKFKINDHQCPAREFDDVLNQAKEKFKKLEKNIKKTGTFYVVPVKYSFVQREQKWTYYNDVLRAYVNKEFIKITNPETKRQFSEVFTKRQKNGKYKVNATYYTALSDSLKVHINSVKRKYKYVTHFGVSSFAHFQVSPVKIGIPPLVGPFIPLDFDHLDVFTFNAHVIFHRIGFFAGTMYNFDKRTIRTNGIYLGENFPTYVEGGLYVGIASYFYLKGGFSYLETKTEEYYNEFLMVSKNDQRSTGIVAGIAFMFPFLSIEAGYNTNLSSLYAGMGLHVTLNK
ncbi:MAG: hypothetical protein ACPGR5_02750 [Chitinophagales bacterium]